MNNEEIPLYPVAQLSVGPIPALGLVVIRPDFLTHATQTPEEFQIGRNYALTPVQADYLAQQILAALVTLENSEQQGDGLRKH